MNELMIEDIPVIDFYFPNNPIKPIKTVHVTIAPLLLGA